MRGSPKTDQDGLCEVVFPQIVIHKDNTRLGWVLVGPAAALAAFQVVDAAGVGSIQHVLHD